VGYPGPQCQLIPQNRFESCSRRVEALSAVFGKYSLLVHLLYGLLNVGWLEWLLGGQPRLTRRQGTSLGVATLGVGGAWLHLYPCLSHLVTWLLPLPELRTSFYYKVYFEQM